MSDMKQKAQESIRKQESANATTDIVATKDTYLTLIEENKEQIKKALSGQIEVDRFVRAALTAISREPKLKECSPRSILGCIIQAGQLDLEIGNSLQHAHMIPFKGQAQFIIGYQGYIELIMRTGKVKSIYAQVVKENDEFDYQYGTEPFLRHKPSPGERGATKGAYAVAQLISGAWVFEYMSKDQLERIRAQAPSGDQKVWREHTDEKYRVTTLRRLQKYLPKSSATARAEQLHDLNETGTPQGLDVSKINEHGEIPINEPAKPEEAQEKATDAKFEEVKPTASPNAGVKLDLDPPTTARVQHEERVQENQVMSAILNSVAFPQTTPAVQVEPPAQPPEAYKALLKQAQQAKTRPELNKAPISINAHFNKTELSPTQYEDLSDFVTQKLNELKKK